MLNKVISGLKDPPKAFRVLREKYTRWRTGVITFHPDNLPETKNPEKYSIHLHDDWMALSQELEDIEADRTLEIGCNYGRWIPWVSDRTEEYHAIDPVQEAIEVAENQFRGVNFEQTVASDLPFPDDFFDFVFSWAVFMHVPPDDIEPSIEEIKRVTEPDGVIVLGEEVGGEGTDIVYPRSPDEWEQLLAPKELVSSTQHQKRDTRHAMRFE